MDTYTYVYKYVYTFEEWHRVPNFMTHVHTSFWERMYTHSPLNQVFTSKNKNHRFFLCYICYPLTIWSKYVYICIYMCVYIPSECISVYGKKTKSRRETFLTIWFFLYPEVRRTRKDPESFIRNTHSSTRG